MPDTDWQDAKEQIRQAVDIVDLVGSYVSLRRQGRGFVGICPWHDDSRPSLQVNPQRQSFKCWVCDIGGDIFSFVMKMEGVDFREAMEMLADRAGIELRRTARTDSGSEFDRRNLYRAVGWAEQHFHRCLLQAPEAEPARRYLAERGISGESIERFRLGFTPDEWDWLLVRARQSGPSPAVLERVGLAIGRQEGSGHYDRFRGRLLFPIHDTRSRPVAFGGRLVPGVGDGREGAKYINSPETPLFSKSAQLYALDQARDGIARDGGIVVMEGYTDVIMAHQHGITNTVAVLGTALTERHVPLVKRFTDRVTLVLDGDEAGQKRTNDILDALLALFVKQEIDLQILVLPTGSDPCDVIATQGREAFSRLLSQSVDALQHKINAVTNGLASATDTHGVSRAVEEILVTLARATGPERASAAMLREQQVLSRLSHQFGIGEDALRTRLADVRRSSAPRRHDAPQSRATEHDRIRPSALELELIELLLHFPETHAELLGAFGADDVRHPACREVLHMAAGISRGGQTATFDLLMTSAEDPEVKSLLVSCDESGRAKSASDTRRRIADLLRGKELLEERTRHESVVAGLRKKELPQEREDEFLNQLFQDLSRRQAGPKPTDG